MEIRIIEERTNPLLKRHELRFEVAHATAATPTRDSVRTELAKAVQAAKDRVVIERMRPRYGTAVTRGEANVYDSAEAAKSITRGHILVRNGLKDKEVKGAPPAAPSTPSAAPEPAKPEAAAAAPTPAPPGETAESKPHESEPHEPRPHEPRPHESKPHEPKPHESKPHEPKPHEPKSAESTPPPAKKDATDAAPAHSGDAPAPEPPKRKAHPKKE
jgi:small subunit ribosomal protein S24e